MKIFCLIILLSGCAIGQDGRLTGAGSASYEYSRILADGSICTVSVLSGRDVIGGNLEIDQNCNVKAKADSTLGVNDALKVIDNGISMTREALTKIP